MTATTQGIVGKAMLVDLKISIWEARKHDREVTEKVNAEYAASRDAGRYHKRLFGSKVPELAAIQTAYGHLRDAHRSQTLPWSEEGWRILPTSNYFEYAKAIRARRREYEDAVERFVAAYPRLVEEARGRLNGMYREADYPAPDRVHLKYGVAVEYAPIPAGEDFRCGLPVAELERVANETEARVVDVVKEAMRAAWSRLHEALAPLTEHLSGDGRHLRDTMIERLTEVADVLGRLNLTEDGALEEVRGRVLQDLATLDAASLRKDGRARAEAAAKADAILERMKSAYNPNAEEVK